MATMSEQVNISPLCRKIILSYQVMSFTIQAIMDRLLFLIMLMRLGQRSFPTSIRMEEELLCLMEMLQALENGLFKIVLNWPQFRFQIRLLVL